MKRSAPGGAVGGQGATKRVATTGAAPAKDGQGLTTSDALTYLREVKNRFTNQREIYDQFLDVMKEFKAQIIDTNGVIAKVKTLFKGHPELVMGFNMFLPAGYKIESPGIGPSGAASGSQRSVPSQARSRPTLTKEQQLQRRREREAAAAAESNKKKAPEIIRKGPVPGNKGVSSVATAEEPKDKSKQPVEFDQAINYVNKIKKRFAGDERVYKAFLEILNQYRKGLQSIGQVYERVSILFQDQSDLLEEFTYFLPDTSQQKPQQTTANRPRPVPNRPPAKQRPPAGPTARQAGRQEEEEDPMPGGRPGTRQATRAGRRTASEEGTGGRGNTLGAGGGRGGQSAPKACLAKELRFFDRLKQKLRNKDAHGDLLRCLLMFSFDLITKTELETLASGILVNHQDLLQGFFDFVDACPQVDFAYEEGKDPKRDEGLTSKEKSMLQDAARREKYMTTCISELDLNSMEHCSTSYRRLPADYPPMTASGRTPMQQAVLNDFWVSVITGSEDYSFKHMRKNQYEDALFRCEDDRFELDMVMESNLSALRAVDMLVQRFKGMTAEEKQRMSLGPKDLSVIQRRAVERLYGEQGSTVLELLNRNPSVTLPILQGRLQQKHEEFVRVKREMEPHWQKQYEANYINSLDHRSFYFKQSDRKHLSHKGIVADMKELADKRTSTEAFLSSVPPGAISYLRTAALPPDMELGYDERQTHEECYRLIVCAAGEFLGPAARIRAMDLWHSILEPLLGCPQHAEENEDVGNKEEIKKENLETDGESIGAPATAASEAMDVDSNGKSRGTGDGNFTSGKEGDDESSGDSSDGGHAAAKEIGEEVMKKASRKDDDDDEEEECEMDGEEAGGEEEEDDEDKSQRFRACRPVMPACATWEYPQVPGASDKAQAYEDVLYCNENFFVAVRLHEILYKRLQAAKKCCHEGKKRPFNPHGQKVIKTDEELAQEKQKAEEVYERFLSALESVVMNKMDSTAFEDEMRPLLGNNAYITFTLDKLLHKFIKQLQVLAQDPTMPRLQSLKRYEGIRSREKMYCDGQPKAMAEAVYCADALMLLQDETCFRMAFNYCPFPDSPKMDSEDPRQAAAQGRSAHVQVTLVDMPFYCPPDGPGCGPPADFEAFLKGWLSRDDDDDGIPSFMTRGLQRALRKRVTKVGALVPDMKDCEVWNGLELKLACATSKVSYVLGTEDVFSRRRSHGKVDPKVAEVAEAKKSQAFNTWIERIAMIFGIEDGKEEDGQEGAGTDRGQFLMAAVENGADMSEHDDGEDGSHDDGEDDDDMEADDDVNGS